MPVATREEVFEVTIPAKTAESAPVTVNTHFNPGTVVGFDLVFPPGPAGLVGARVTTNGQAIWPRTKGAWWIADNEAIRREPGNWPNTGRLEITGFNTDVNPHTLEVRYQVIENATERAPLTAAQSEPVEIAAGGEPVGIGEAPTPAPPPTPEGEGPAEPPTSGEQPIEPTPAPEGEPAPSGEEVKPESEPTPVAPPEAEAAPTPAAPEPEPAGPEEPPVPEPGTPGAPSSPGPTPAQIGKPLGISGQTVKAFERAHHGHPPKSRKELEDWYRHQYKRKPAKGKPVKGKRSSVGAAKRAGAARHLPTPHRLGLLPSQATKRKATAARHAEPSHTARRTTAPTAVRDSGKRTPAGSRVTGRSAGVPAHPSTPARREAPKAAQHHAAAPPPRRAPAPEHHAPPPPPPPRRAPPPPPPPPPQPRREAPKPARKGRR